MKKKSLDKKDCLFFIYLIHDSHLAYIYKTWLY